MDHTPQADASILALETSHNGFRLTEIDILSKLVFLSQRSDIETIASYNDMAKALLEYDRLIAALGDIFTKRITLAYNAHTKAQDYIQELLHLAEVKQE